MSEPYTPTEDEFRRPETRTVFRTKANGRAWALAGFGTIGKSEDERAEIMKAWHKKDTEFWRRKSEMQVSASSDAHQE